MQLSKQLCFMNHWHVFDHAAKFLFQLGIELKRIEVVGDDTEAIQSTIRRLSSMHDFVFTSGGIGKV